MPTADISILLGKTVRRIELTSDSIEFHLSDNQGLVVLEHEQECCEDVFIEDIVGDLTDLLNTPITRAEMASSQEDGDAACPYYSTTWTFYKLATIEGYVDIRWFGGSNGYYSEEVSVIHYPEEEVQP